MDDYEKQVKKVAKLSRDGRVRLERIYQYEMAKQNARRAYVWLDLSPFTNADKALNAAGALLTLLSLLCLWLLWLGGSGHAHFVMYTIGVTGGAYTVSLTLLSAYRIIKRIGSLPA